ncbi:hypothetical protein BX667DRAFT_424284 [Coemansia mojavensis]|nr:hypothetical protein BX667DRAFT_424284 [Coemansia mojavensis]
MGKSIVEINISFSLSRINYSIMKYYIYLLLLASLISGAVVTETQIVVETITKYVDNPQLEAMHGDTTGSATILYPSLLPLIVLMFM